MAWDNPSLTCEFRGPGATAGRQRVDGAVGQRRQRPQKQSRTGAPQSGEMKTPAGLTEHLFGPFLFRSRVRWWHFFKVDPIKKTFA